MADESLKDPITVTAAGINAASLPVVFSPAYRMYVLSQSLDFTRVTGKANDAGQGAYDAQIKNDEQDVTLSDHGRRIHSAEQTLTEHGNQLDNHEKRISRTEDELAKLDVRVLNVELDVDGLKIKIQDLDGKISEITVDYVSLSRTAEQNLLSPLNVTSSYSVDGVKVVSRRVTGFTAATGSALKGAFNASQTYTASATYTQSEIQTMATGLTAARQRIKALEDAMRSHGLID